MHKATVMFQYHLYIGVMNCRTEKREYGDRIREVELASFTPLVFATTDWPGGSMGREAVMFYRQLAEHKALSYGSTLAWLYCTLSFSLIRSATMCISSLVGAYRLEIISAPSEGLVKCPSIFCQKNRQLLASVNCTRVDDLR